jgi:hypothetical protein
MSEGDHTTHLRSCWRGGRRLRSRSRHSLDLRNVTLRHQTHRIAAAKLHGDLTHAHEVFDSAVGIVEASSQGLHHLGVRSVPDRLWQCPVPAVQVPSEHLPVPARNPSRPYR